MDKKYIFMILFLLAISLVSFLVYQSQGLKRTYKSEVSKGLNRTAALENQILTEDDIKDLPLPVQKYLRYVGVTGKERVYNFRAVLEGEMKMNPSKDWVKIKAEQYNFFDDNLTRMFFMKANVNGIPCLGLHYYNNAKAGMLIKLLGMITVLDAKGQEMRIGDTTTLFNDMCFFAPATLIDKRIQWKTIDSNTTKATFNNNGCKISAMLYFNEKGELINFVSEDRFYIPIDGTSRRAIWSTPISKYKDFNGIKRPTYGEAVWKLPEGDYCYAKFTNIIEVEINCKSSK